jgi:hypothetical protein
MEEEELSALVVSLRASMAAVQEAAKKSCGFSDLKRATERMGVYFAGKIDPSHSDSVLQMIADLVYFEPTERGIRAFDRFLSGPVLTLPERDQDIARRLGRASFSVFRPVGQHDMMGTWIEDILENDRRIWLIDLDTAKPSPLRSAFAARVFDAGQFHLTLATIVSINDRIANVFKRAAATGRRPYRRSLAATIYGLAQLSGVRPTHASGRKFVDDLGPELQPGDG